MSQGADRRRTIVVAVAASAVFIVVAVMFANATTASRVAGNAQDLHWTNATLGTAALARAAAGQVATFADLADSGVVSAEATATARGELTDVTASLEELAAAAPAHFQPPLDDLLTLLSRSPLEIDAIDGSYRSLAVDLSGNMARLEERIETSDTAADRLSGFVRLFVTLIIPTAAIFIYRRRAAEQVRSAEVRMDAQIAAEREISRAKDQFIAGMSHEMRTPLTGIYGFSEVLLDSPADAELDRELVTEIQTQAAELSRMVDDFIAASRIDGPGIDIDLTPLDVGDVAANVVEPFRRRGIVIDIEGDAPLAEADSGRTRQILANLVANAVHHGGPGIRIDVASDDTFVRCAVIDDGGGVADEMKDRLFSRFIHEGTEVLVSGSLGLGTWVSRQFARAMGGDVTYQRREGDTVFTLELPRAEVEIEVEVAELAPPEPALAS